MIEKYLNIEHNWQENNCLTIICRFYEEELGINWEEERKLFNNFNFRDMKEVRKVSIDSFMKLQNWQTINLQDIQIYDILVYAKNNKLSHFAMYIGNFKVLDLTMNCRSVLKHLNDTQLNNFYSCFRHKKLVT